MSVPADYSGKFVAKHRTNCNRIFFSVMHFSFGPFEMYQKSRMTIMAVCGDCSGRLAFLLHQLPRKRQVMLQYAGVYCEYCEAGDASCRSCSDDGGHYVIKQH